MVVCRSACCSRRHHTKVLRTHRHVLPILPQSEASEPDERRLDGASPSERRSSPAQRLFCVSKPLQRGSQWYVATPRGGATGREPEARLPGSPPIHGTTSGDTWRQSSTPLPSGSQRSNTSWWHRRDWPLWQRPAQRLRVLCYRASLEPNKGAQNQPLLARMLLVLYYLSLTGPRSARDERLTECGSQSATPQHCRMRRQLLWEWSPSAWPAWSISMSVYIGFEMSSV